MANDVVGSWRAPKLSEVLFERPLRSFASFAAMPSNIEAIEAALRFSAGLVPFVAIAGPSGWGKSHLLEAVAYRFAHEMGAPIDAASAARFLDSPSGAEGAGPMLLDDAQEALASGRSRMRLRIVLERRVRSGRPTMLALTLPKPSRQLRTILPSAHQWSVATIGPPTAPERAPLIEQLAAAEGLVLAPGLVRILAVQMHGNGRTLAGALKRLRLSGGIWLDARATLRACGVLDPFFADNGDWDLKHRILRVAESSRARFSQAAATDLAVFVMLRVAGLSEAEVARCLGIEPAEAYLRAARFEKQCEQEPTRQAYVERLVALVVESLAAD